MLYRFLEEPDFEPLEKLERRLAPERSKHGYRATPASLRYYSRTRHSFVAEEDGELHGFLLAQAVWQGDRATVLVTRALADDPETLEGLLRALVKSAYDAAAYEVALLVDPEEDPTLARAAQATGLADSKRRLFARVLGARGNREGPEYVLG